MKSLENKGFISALRDHLSAFGTSLIVPKQGGLTKETTWWPEHQSPRIIVSSQLTGHFPILLVLPLLPISAAPLAPTAYLRYPWLGHCCRKFLLVPRTLLHRILACTHGLKSLIGLQGSVLFCFVLFCFLLGLCWAAKRGGGETPPCAGSATGEDWAVCLKVWHAASLCSICSVHV